MADNYFWRKSILYEKVVETKWILIMNCPLLTAMLWWHHLSMLPISSRLEKEMSRRESMLLDVSTSLSLVQGSVSILCLDVRDRQQATMPAGDCFLTLFEGGKPRLYLNSLMITSKTIFLATLQRRFHKATLHARPLIV